MKILWYKSLQFKLFVLMAFCLLTTALSITWKNSEKFSSLLTKQVQENLLDETHKSKNQTLAYINGWFEKMALSSHLGTNSNSSRKITGSLARFLNSSKELVAYAQVSNSKKNLRSHESIQRGQTLR